MRAGTDGTDGTEGTVGRVLPWASWSLRLRLTLVAAGLFGLALVAGSMILSSVVSHSRVAALDEVLGPDARTLAQLASSDQLPAPLPVTEPGEVAQLLDPDGGVLATSASASRTLPVLPTDLLGEAVDGFERQGPGAFADAQFVTTERSVYAGGLVRVALVPTTWQGQDAWAVTALPLTEVEGVVRALRLSLVVVVPLLTLVLGLVIWTILGRALRPVEALRQGAEQVTERGGPGSLPVPAADDELGALARTLNSMLDRLDVSASRQRAFVADAAHELRSPVAALKVSVDIARAHPEAYSSQELAEDLGGEVERLQTLVEDLLVLARVGASRAVHDDVDLRALVDEVVAGSLSVAGRWTQQDDADGSSGRRTDVPVPSVQVMGRGRAMVDGRALSRVIRNLVDNAVRHASTTVRVLVTRTTITVDDDGPGVAVGDRERVFERFTRLDEARQRDAGGSGLGLSIARELAQQDGGDIVLETSDSGGLRAVVRLFRG